ncbi:MAG: phosphoglycolate phosphatase [Magnetococcales bacterium]|nr:phosphoglycolate phosphatase [Magnetococcales bacterium]
MPIRALLFDLDGTLVDSAPDIAGALNHVLRHVGRDAIPLFQVRHLVGRGARDLIARSLWGHDAVIPRNDAAFDAMVKRFFDYYCDHISDGSAPFPGVVETLTLLQQQGYRMAVVTNKTVMLAQLLLTQLQMDHFFSLVVGGDSLPKCKPEPQPLLHAMAQLGTSCAETVMVGDSINDVLAAQAAGCRVVAVSYGYCHEGSVADLNADVVLDRFDQLPAWLLGELQGRR